MRGVPAIGRHPRYNERTRYSGHGRLSIANEPVSTFSSVRGRMETPGKETARAALRSAAGQAPVADLLPGPDWIIIVLEG